MILGHEDLVKTFKRLTLEDKLSHGYIFFGEPQVGKFTFGKSLANYQETGNFEIGDQFLKETLEIHPDEKGVIGIDAIREIKHFLSQKPVNSRKRVVLIDEAEKLTSQAESAILKVSEEPPVSALLIIIVSNPEILLPALSSRFVKIYFQRIERRIIEDFAIKALGLTPLQAKKIGASSFGRPGRAIEMIQNKSLRDLRGEIMKLMKNRRERSKFIRDNYSDKEKINFFISEIISELSKDVESNWRPLKSIYERLVAISEFNVNRRLQLEAALWNI